jgi:hypothetical protein
MRVGHKGAAGRAVYDLNGVEIGTVLVTRA